MIFILSLLLSWLNGLLKILLAAFISYQSFSLVDITSFAVLTLVACITLVPLIYLPVLRLAARKIIVKKQIIGFPLTLLLLANLPVYFIIWLKTNDLYIKNEAMLFVLAFVTIALVFGLAWAWKNSSLQKSR